MATDDSGRRIKIVRGGGAFIWPIFQQAEFLSLLSHKLDVSTPEVYTEQGAPVMADGVAIIKIGGSVEDVATDVRDKHGYLDALGKPRIAAVKRDAKIAEAERAKGTAEAEVIRLRGLAEAKEKLAEAFQKFGEAAVLDIIVKMLPELAGKVAEPLKSIDKLTVVDTGHGEGAARISNYVTSLMATAPEMLKNVSGIDFEQLVQGLTKVTKQAEKEGSAGVAKEKTVFDI